jgi:hypothetical protein
LKILLVDLNRINATKNVSFQKLEMSTKKPEAKFLNIYERPTNELGMTREQLSYEFLDKSCE